MDAVPAVASFQLTGGAGIIVGARYGLRLDTTENGNRDSPITLTYCSNTIDSSLTLPSRSIRLNPDSTNYREMTIEDHHIRVEIPEIGLPPERPVPGPTSISIETSD